MFSKFLEKTAGVRAKASSWLPSSRALGKAAPVMLLAVALTALSMMVMWRQDASYKPLFGTREDIALGDAVAVLDAERVPYRLHPQTGQILVPESRLGAARMMLAGKGVVARLPEGLEQVDRTDPLGVSQFVQDVRFRRGLEGELTRSITSLEPVDSARVHLSIVKSSSFILDDGEKSSASVVLTLKPGRRLKPMQVEAIVAMVAGSVANLDRSRVAVVDQSGAHLTAQLDPSGAATGDGESSQRARDDIMQTIHGLLGPSIGEGQYRAGVTVALDTDRVEETRETYGDKPLVTNEATRDETDKGQLAMGVPGSLSNRPAAANGAGDKNAEAPQSQKQAVIMSVISSTALTLL